MDIFNMTDGLGVWMQGPVGKSDLYICICTIHWWRIKISRRLPSDSYEMASLNSGSKVREPFLGFFEKRRQSVHFKVEDFRAVDIVAHSIRVSFERATEMEESGCISKLGHLLLLHISGQSIFYCISRLMGSVLSDFCLCACWDDSDWFLCKGMQPNTESKHVIWWQMAQQLQLQL